jgi:hypothetical protein
MLFLDLLDIYSESKTPEEFLHKCHINYEQPVFDLLKHKYMDFFKKWWDTYTLPIISETNKSIVIYETRCHINLEFLIYNLTYFARGWGLIIYCSKDSHRFICDILKHNRFRAILHIVRDDEGGKEVRDEYNNFVKSSIFWNSIPTEYVLMCETDTYLRKHIPDNITDYDYVCCKWGWHKDLAGGGGLSFRRVSSMKRICLEHPYLEKIFAQDSWVAEGCKILNLSYNNTYFVESYHDIPDPIGFHQWWTFINPHTFKTYWKNYSIYLSLDIYV